MAPMDDTWLFLVLTYVAFAHHFRSANGISYASKKLSKIAGNSTSYSLNS